MDGTDIKRRFEYLYQLRKGGIEGTWDRIEMYCDPLRGGKFYNEQKTELQIRTREPATWDLTSIWGSSVLAASMQASLTSPGIRWFGLGFQNDKLEKDHEAKAWIEDCSDRMFDAIQESNFNVEIASAYLDLVHYGNTGFTLETESELYWAGLDFSSIPIRGLYFEQDHRNHIRVLYKRLEWSAAQVIDKWGLETQANLLRIAKDRNKAPEGTDFKYEIIYCVYPRQEILDRMNQERRKAKEMREPQTLLAPTLRPYGCKYIYREDGSDIGEEGGYYEMPAFIARWEKTSGSMWGHGPSAIALPTIQYLNAWLETEMAAAEKVADPAILSTERGVISQLDLRPGGNTVVRSIEDVVPFESKAQFPVVERRIEDLRDMIRKVYHTDDLKLKESPAMTATEVQARWELMTRLLGSTVTRLQDDLLSPLIERTFNIMYRAERFASVPPSVLRSDPHLDIRYHGPIMRAQRADEVGAIERLAGMVSTLAQQGFPQAVDYLDPLAMIKAVAERLSVPAVVIRSDGDIKQLEQQRMQAAQMQAQQVQAQTAETNARTKKTNAEAAAAAGPQAGTAGQQLLEEAQRTSPNPLKVA